MRDAQVALDEPARSDLLHGRIVHRLLEILPALPDAKRRAAFERILARDFGLDREAGEAAWEEARAVLAHPALRTALGQDARAEAAIVGNVATEKGIYAVSGRIDRLVREPNGWRLLDFKTSRAVPAAPSEIDSGTLMQLGLYRRLLKDMEPEAEVRATLLYTAGPNVMHVPPELMDGALKKLGIR
jgi:ATP-dependent helicase/nuclease subunit A